jgi:hypothetical protein
MLLPHIHGNASALEGLLRAPFLATGACNNVEVEVTLRQSVSQYVLASSTLVGHTTRYYFLSECYYTHIHRIYAYIASGFANVCG